MTKELSSGGGLRARLENTSKGVKQAITEGKGGKNIGKDGAAGSGGDGDGGDGEDGGTPKQDKENEMVTELRQVVDGINKLVKQGADSDYSGLADTITSGLEAQGEGHFGKMYSSDDEGPSAPLKKEMSDILGGVAKKIEKAVRISSEGGKTEGQTMQEVMRVMSEEIKKLGRTRSMRDGSSSGMDSAMKSLKNMLRELKPDKPKAKKTKPQASKGGGEKRFGGMTEAEYLATLDDSDA